MRLLWTAVKVALALALVIPVSIIVLATALSVLGAFLGVAILVLKIAIAAFVAWGVFRVARALLWGRSSQPVPSESRYLPAADPYYEAAKRELDRELGHASR